MLEDNFVLVFLTLLRVGCPIDSLLLLEAGAVAANLLEDDSEDVLEQSFRRILGNYRMGPSYFELRLNLDLLLVIGHNQA